MEVHVMAIPYPGRGHINPLMNLCKLMATNRPNLVVTFIVTEEWLSFLMSESKPSNIHFRTIPNVIPSEKVRSKDILGFLQAVFTMMEGPVESLLQGLDLPEPNVIISDSVLPWVVRLGKRRNIPVASFWTASATVFSTLYHHEASLSEQEEGLIINYLLQAVSLVTKAQYLLFTTIEALESQVIEALKAEFPVPIYIVGPTIPYFIETYGQNQSIPNYFSWLDDQPKDSVLYISQGSFMSVSNKELDEIVDSVQSSGIRFFWVVRENVPTFEDGVIGNRGMVVPWCDQLNVLCHPSVGGFWSHCGWNSTKEGAFAGVPFLTSPIDADQVANSKQIVEDWKIGWRVNRESDNIVKREEIAPLLQKFMDLDCFKGREMRRRAMEIRKICQEAIEGGIVEQKIDKFLHDISQCRVN